MTKSGIVEQIDKIAVDFKSHKAWGRTLLTGLTGILIGLILSL